MSDRVSISSRQEGQHCGALVSSRPLCSVRYSTDQGRETTPIAFHAVVSRGSDDRRIRSPPGKAGTFRPPRPEIPPRFTNLDLDRDRPDGVRNRAGHLGAFLPWCKLERDDYHPRWSFAR